jgi:hypothetical protein
VLRSNFYLVAIVVDQTFANDALTRTLHRRETDDLTSLFFLLAQAPNDPSHHRNHTISARQNRQSEFSGRSWPFLDKANQPPDRVNAPLQLPRAVFLDSRCSQPGNLAVHEHTAKEYQTAQRLQFWSSIPQRQRSAVRRSLAT